VISGEGDTRTVIVERQFAAPPEKLWRALTQPHLIEEWLMKTDLNPIEGHRFTLRKDPTPEISVVIDCEMRTVEENKTLSYTWSAYGIETLVTFSLTPVQGGTRLRLEQAGFPADNKAAIKGANASWPIFLTELEKLLTRIG